MNFVIQSKNNKNNIIVMTQWGRLIFEKYIPSSININPVPLGMEIKTHQLGPNIIPFGCKITMFIKKHGDLGCPCTTCSLYNITEEYKKKGYHLVEFIEDKQN